jgi:hypothetical protein
MDTIAHEKSDFTLSIRDRCDQCWAPAVVKTKLMEGGSLLWCSHHFGRNHAALVSFGAAVVIDQRTLGSAPLPTLIKKLIVVDPLHRMI